MYQSHIEPENVAIQQFSNSIIQQLNSSQLLNLSTYQPINFSTILPIFICVKQITKKYTNGEVTIVWQPHLCIHSTICFRGLPQVFDPRRRPWITPEEATTTEMILQVKKCPSGALSFIMNDEKPGD